MWVCVYALSWSLKLYVYVCMYVCRDDYDNNSFLEESSIHEMISYGGNGPNSIGNSNNNGNGKMQYNSSEKMISNSVSGMYVCTYVCVCMYVCMYVCTVIQDFVCMYVIVCMYVRTYCIKLFCV